MVANDEFELPRPEAHSRLVAIVESSDDAIVSKSLDGIIQTWNKGAERIFGWTAAEVIGKPITIIIPEDRLQEEPEILARLRLGERVDHIQTIRMAKDGRRVDVSVTISPVRDLNGNVIGASKIARDITLQKQIERELESARQIAEEANALKDTLLERERAARADSDRAGRLKDDFLATLSHELRTPLNAIIGWSQILRDNPTDQDVVEGIAIIERNARMQAQIIDDLLDMSRIISGKIRLDVQRVDLANVVRTAVETVQPAANAKGIKLQIVLDPNAGPTTGDPGRLQQVFWNLLNNAVKFTPKGGRIQVLLERIDSQVEVSVVDTGEGIAPEFLPYVFDRFRQAESGTARRHGGLGIGLSLAKQLVELHGGAIRVNSEGSGLGATFTVVLPLTGFHAETNLDAQRRHPSSGGAIPVLPDTCAQIAGVKILVVDDEQDARDLIARLLRNCNAIVTTAASAEQAIQSILKDPPDLMVSDIGMAEEDGYALIKRVRALDSDKGGKLPAIALTAYARAEDRMKAMIAGFEQYLVKPVEPAELITIVSVVAARAMSR